MKKHKQRTLLLQIEQRVEMSEGGRTTPCIHLPRHYHHALDPDRHTTYYLLLTTWYYRTCGYQMFGVYIREENIGFLLGNVASHDMIWYQFQY